MTDMERWQLAGTAPEVYADYLVPALFGPWVPVALDLAQLGQGSRCSTLRAERELWPLAPQRVWAQPDLSPAWTTILGCSP
jgi:hypothetical protein